MFSRLRSFLTAWTRRERFEDSLDEEVRFHLDAYAECSGINYFLRAQGENAEQTRAKTFLVAAPFLMTYAIRLAARGRYRAHRTCRRV